MTWQFVRERGRAESPFNITKLNELLWTGLTLEGFHRDGWIQKCGGCIKRVN